MKANNTRNLGPQPIMEIMAKDGLRATDLVSASTEQITHKMVSKACKGRRLTKNIQQKILNALNKVSEKNYVIGDLFTY